MDTLENQHINTADILSPVVLGPYRLRNRMVMAPMTRSRAGAGNVPQDLNVTYYAQRASAGLIVTEATQISPQGVGYPDTPGIHTRAQVDGWKKVTSAVNARGGRIFAQLWHVGRISHPNLQPGRALPVAPSAIRPAGKVFTGTAMEPFVTPRALETDEIIEIVEDFWIGAANALAAGFDGVELHAANGYLIDQFLRDGTNKRTDRYGGSAENRVRFLLEVTEAVIRAWGASRVGVRISPVNPYNDIADSTPQDTFEFAARKLSRLGIAYLHVVEPGNQPIDYARLRSAFSGIYVANGGYDKVRANATIASGRADLVAFGVPFLANPDLPMRFAENAPLNPPDRQTFYGGDSKGYTDYLPIERAA